MFSLNPIKQKQIVLNTSIVYKTIRRLRSIYFLSKAPSGTYRYPFKGKDESE